MGNEKRNSLKFLCLFRFQLKASSGKNLFDISGNSMEDYVSLEAIKRSSKRKIYNAVSRKKGTKSAPHLQMNNILHY